MEWIYINEDSEIPEDKNVIVEDCNGWIGQAYKTPNGDWVLETFGQVSWEIAFDKIIKYAVLDD